MSAHPVDMPDDEREGYEAYLERFREAWGDDTPVQPISPQTYMEMRRLVRENMGLRHEEGRHLHG